MRDVCLADLGSREGLATRFEVLCIIIPAMVCRTREKVRGKKREFRLVERRVIGAYLSRPYSRASSTKSQMDLLHRWERWRAHARCVLEKKLKAIGVRPAEPISSKGWKVHVQPYHESGRHPDGTNVLKGIEDILVCRKRGKGSFLFTDDKYLAGEYGAPRYDTENPRLVLQIIRIGKGDQK